ncbi:MAG: DUF5069 domain-containing protein [Verrucomicrobia bacterium]|nr:MAG: DUF5069 domain-containing protein [Verrucomicrobiota bacterium]
MTTLNLEQRPPRSPRVRLGGFVILPRILDKCRATLTDSNGNYGYACPLDQRFLSFVGIDPEALKEQVKNGLGDGEILNWIHAHAQNPRNELEINTWSRFQEQHAPTSIEEREFFNKLQKAAGPNRSDLVTFFDLLDLDDFVTFGGKP